MGQFGLMPGCHTVFLLLLWPMFHADAQSNLHKQAVALYDQRKYQEAVAAFEKTLPLENPRSAEYAESTRDLGQSYLALQQPAKAIFWLEKTTATAEVSFMLGNAYLQTRNLEKAEIAFANLFGVPAHSAAGHLLTAELMMKREYEDDALAQANQALAIDPKIPMGHFILGEIAIFRGRLDDGVAEMRKELELNPNYSMAWYRLGEVLARQEQWSAAIPNLERSIWLNASFSGPYIVLGKCYFKTADYVNAEGILKHALTLDPNNYAATYLLGQTLVAGGKKEEGRALLEKLKTMEHR